MSNWQASWITDSEFADLHPISMLHKEDAAFTDGEYSHPQHLMNRHVYFRKSFILNHQPRQALLNISADDYYKLYVNGIFVGQGPAQSYHFHYKYNEWDVSEYLDSGHNTIAIHVYYQGLLNRAYNSGDLRMGVIAELYDGRNLLLSTDNTWRFHRAGQFVSSDMTGYDTQFLENIDQRFQIAGWQTPEFPDQKWEYAAEKRYADYLLFPQATPSVSVYRKAPSFVHQLAEGHYLIDFGHELTGQFELKALGEAGQAIELRYGEELEPDGQSVKFDMRCNCRYIETWTLSGREDTLEQFEYKAFRYIEVIGPPDALYPDSFAAIVRHYPLDDTACQFKSEDPLLQQIWEICKLGVQLCAQENFVDCPSREKGQYLGDNTVMGHTHMYISGDLRLFKKAIHDFALSAQACPGLLAVAPGHYMQEIADFSLQWPMQLLNYYRHSADMEFLAKMHPVAEGIVTYFKRYSREDGLLENVKDKWNLVDWPDNLRDGYDFPLTRPVGDGCHNVINALYYGSIQAVQEIRDILKIAYKDELPRLKQTFMASFYRADKMLFADAAESSHTSLHANIFPLLFDIAPADAIDSIVDLIMQKRMSCGVYMSYFLLKALARHGRNRLVYDLITGEDERSWANMVREGATSCFEAWGKEQKWNTSLCHGWASAPIPVLIEDIIGISPLEPGWTAIKFTPSIPEGMKDFQLRFRTAVGEVTVDYADGKLAIDVPPGARLVN
ncbi:family 78 glycoside hydrolase catalytic domain [Paenibacillus sp. JDR-2]|uniref:family 78 glycoside hydrolase catalytic domain n=1 Tax=Paenibacillus sp. (strain JDR-2) TaxID=324057 RepID=UPI00016646D1|nr:family 78 glycoside hydrolase catalytic domain [Paenibacillus sp. JDR-2]ACT03635.1 alpha-L-rhamnosidase [Paenibacillus sp. JDR-2]